MTAKSLEAKVSRSMAWAASASGIISVLELVSVVIIFRFWLETGDFGVATTVIMGLAGFELAAEALAGAVIQRDDLTRERVSSVFWFNSIFGFLVYGLAAVLAAGLWALGAHLVAAVIWVYAINIPLKAVIAVPHSLLRREFRYGELSIIRVLANFVALAARIILAALGFGLWCFIVDALLKTVLSGIAVFVRAKWWPKLVFHWREAAAYVSFGIKASGARILFYLYSNIDYAVVLAFFGKEAIDLYSIAYRLVLEPIKYFSDLIVNIGFAAFSRLKDDRDKLIGQFLSFTRQNLIIVGTLVALVLLAADEMLLVLGERGVSAADAARLLAVVGVFRAVGYVGPPLLDGLGRPGLTLRYQAVAALVLPSLFVAFAHLFGDRIGYLSVAVAWMVGYPIAFTVLSIMCLSLIKLTARDYIMRVIGVFLCVMGAMAAGYGARLATIGQAPWLRLAAIIAALLVALGVLLARFQGISPRAIWRSFGIESAEEQPSVAKSAD